MELSQWFFGGSMFELRIINQIQKARSLHIVCVLSSFEMISGGRIGEYNPEN